MRRLLLPTFPNPVRHYITGNSPSGHGATNTKIRTFTNATQVGTAAVYATSAADGMSITITEPGLYFMANSDLYSGGAFVTGWSVNSSELTTNLDAILAATRIIISQNAAGLLAQTSAMVWFAVGDIVRIHDNGTSNTTAAAAQFIFLKVI